MTPGGARAPTALALAGAGVAAVGSAGPWVTVLGAGMAEGYGTRRIQRGQLVCENCGCVVAIDLARLGATGGGS